MDHSTTKRCSKCGVEKPLSEYHARKETPDGRRADCKACVRDRQKQWHPDYVQRRSLLRENPTAPTKRCTKCEVDKPLSAYHKHPHSLDGLRPICKECVYEYQHARRSDPRYADKVKDSEYRKYHNQPEHKKKAMNRRIHERHKERYWNDPIYRARSMERSTTKVNNRRVKKARNGGKHTTKEWQELCEKYNHCCLRCGQKKRLTRDHIVPVEDGGSGDISNIQPLCKSCNSWKGTKTIDYRPDMGEDA